MKQELLYEGKAKQIYSTANPDEVIIYYKDDATAGNGAKKAQFEDKGRLNSEISHMIYTDLMKNGVETHLIKAVNEREQLCHKVEIILLEAIVRNIAAGSLVKRIGLQEGLKLNPPILEFCYKEDSFNDPLINDDHAVALGLASHEELAHIRGEMLKINEYLKALWLEVGIDLVDFKIEFGRTKDGRIVLADEISPDTCRLWDSKTGEKLDKDRFRQDMGGVIEAYEEIHRRLKDRT